MNYSVFIILLAIITISCSKTHQEKQTTNTMITVNNDQKFRSGYSDVNGIKMYYEIYGEGKPLILIHGGGSTINTSFGRIIPQLAKHRQVIGIELQAHGHTTDRDIPLSFEQDADDVASLMENLNISKADIFGFSNGGTTALQVAIRHPEKVNKIITASMLCKREGVPDEFWDFMKNATLDQMPQQYKDAYLKVAPDKSKLRVMGDKCAQRMVNFKDINDEQLQAITAPTLIVVADKDVMFPEHAVNIHRLIPNSRLAIIPGVHGEYIGEITTLGSKYEDNSFITKMIEDFLNKGN